MAFHVGTVSLTLRLHGCRSLKEKRQVVRSFVERLKNQFNVSAAEVEHQDTHDLAGLGLAFAASDHDRLQRLIEHVIDFTEQYAEAELVGVETELL